MTTEEREQMTTKGVLLLVKESLNEARAMQNELEVKKNELEEYLGKILTSIEEKKVFIRQFEEQERILEEHMQNN